MILDRLRELIVKRPIVSSGLAGLFFGLAFPPLPFPFQLLMPIGIAIWLRIIAISQDTRTALVHLFYGILVANTVVSYWLSLATVAGGIAAVIAKSVVMSLMLWPFIWFHRRLSSGSMSWLLALVASWIFAEGIDLFWDLSYPWLWAGNAWANMPILYQYISITGVHGLSAWVILLALVFYQLIFNSNHQNRYSKWFYALTILAPIALSVILYMFKDSALENAESNNHITALLVQPNHNSYADFSGFADYDELIESLIKQTDDAIKPETEIIYWPENALDPYIMNRAVNRYQQMVQDAVDRWQIPLITGTTYREYYDATDSLSLPLVVHNRESKYPLRLFNSAIHFQPNGPIEVYKKMRLVPLVEKLPFERWLVKTGLFGINWEEWSLFGKGQELNLFGADSLNAPALICYDSAFPELGIDAVKNGAEYLAIITNDGWWGHSSGHIQHFVLSKLRAVETGRYIFRAANNGISAIIDSRGISHKETAFWTQDVVHASIPLLSHQTFFAKYGYWFVYLCFGLTAFFFVSPFIKNKMNQ